MTTVALRPAGDDDEAFLRALYATTRAAELEMLPDELRAPFANSQYDLQRTHYLAYHPGATWSVVEVDGRAVGRFIVDRTVDPWLLVDIAIGPEHRNLGVGTHLITGLCHEAALMAKNVVLTVWASNHGARRLYGRVGFEPLPGRHDEHGFITMTTTGGKQQ
jgi:ribosomal protein S18 acetylase RimI-like enzyme